jgi:hypothetical protein
MTQQQPRVIKRFSAKHLLEYDRGQFDNWCIYLTLPGRDRYPPTDVEYFTWFRELARIHYSKAIYDDFVVVYNRTGPDLEQQVLDLITALSMHYAPDNQRMDIMLTIVYAGMVAEENKEKAILKKKVKRLGMHQLLIEHFDPEDAANFSRGKKWQELNKECEKRGF